LSFVIRNLKEFQVASDDKEKIYDLLKRLRFDQASGQLTEPRLGDVLVLLSFSFRNMVRWSTAKFGAGSSMIWYNIGKAAATPLLEPFERMKGEASQEEFVKLINDYTTVMGWGRVTTPKFDSAGRSAVVQITNSALTRGIDKGYGCDFIRGYLSGLYEMIFESKTFCEETLCESKGARLCEFHLIGR
jgi:predicted hydrocarbon binding protein